MAVRTRDEILNNVRGHFTDDTSDEVLTLIEDLTDTMADLENKANNNGTNWEQKYRDNDAAWRKKYRDRFFSADKRDEEEDIPEPGSPKKYTYENLFKEG